MTESEFLDHVRRIKQDGFSILPGVLTRSECQEAQRELERLLAEERGLPGAPHGRHGAQVYNLFNKARIFETFYQRPPLLRLIRHFLGHDAVMSAMQAHVIYPGSPAQGLHSDGSITGPNRPPAPADEGRRVTSHTLGFNVVFCVSDYTAENGATRLVPNSHLVESLSVNLEASGLKDIIIEAERGSVLIFNISTWHGSSEHRGGEPRFAVMNPWRRQWIRPEAELARIVHPGVLERAGAEGPAVFGVAAVPAYLDRWQWDLNAGRPKPEWERLRRD